VIYVCLGFMAFAFILILVSGYFAVEPLAWLGLVVFALGLLGGIVVAFTWSAGLRCSACGSRFRTKRVPVAREI